MRLPTIPETRSKLEALRYRIGRNALRFTVQTLKELPPEPPADRNVLVLFAHFDPQDEVDDYVRFYLQKLYELGAAIVFISGSPRLKPAAAARVAPYCVGMYTRETLSLDFGSWHLGWEHLRQKNWRLESFDRFILANDSVYGPLFDLKEMFAAFTGADMYGVTESLELGPHLQSYFLCWDLNEKTRRFLTRFWKRFQYETDKVKLIQRYEIGISKKARAANLRLKAFISDADAQAAAAAHRDHEHLERVEQGKANNTLYLWDTLIAHLRCPFLKTDLPRRNRYQSQKLADLPAFLSRWTEYDPGLITSNLDRLGLPEPSASQSAPA